MIRSNEVRIGNHTTFGVVYLIEDDYFYTKMDGASYKSTWADIQPIPITPKILEKCGFEKHSNSNEYWEFYKLKDWWYVVWALHKEPSAGVREGFLYYGDNYQEIKYLHQLQNLYYALTNKELEIKL